jgi:hypothetical protein
MAILLNAGLADGAAKWGRERVGSALWLLEI